MNSITTYSKVRINPLSPNSADIQIRDIAHALSMLCRAGGHFPSFYSVGQHSINCMKEARARGYNRKIQLACLLHDGSEAYLSDIIRPLKSAMPEYRKYERNLQNAIWDKWLEESLTIEEEKAVFAVDDAMLYYEFEYLMGELIFDERPELASSPSFSFSDFFDTECEFIRYFDRLVGVDVPSFTVGIDGMGGKWIAVTQDNGVLGYHIYDEVADICAVYENAVSLLIDMPIGLPENRREDLLRPEWPARKIVKGRSSSFFAVPYRQIIYAESVQEIKTWEKQLGKGNSSQSLAISGMIKQVDAFLQGNPVWKNRLQESHPELAFYALNGEKPLLYAKKNSKGIDERIAILREYCDVDRLVGEFLAKGPGRRFLNDLLDALSLAVVGMLGVQCGFLYLPSAPEVDSTGLRMQMVYAVKDAKLFGKGMLPD